MIYKFPHSLKFLTLLQLAKIMLSICFFVQEIIGSKAANSQTNHIMSALV